MIGIDIIEVTRLAKLLERRQFLTRMFTETENQYIQERHENLHTLGGLIAAKEAVAKAFGVGISRDISFKEIEVLHDQNGAPYINEKKPEIKKLMSRFDIAQISINISHDGDFAVAVCDLKKNKLQETIDHPFFNPSLLRREDNANKYDFGQVLFIGGKRGMSGSVVLSSMAALRSGAGLVHLLVPESIRDIVEIKTREQIVHSISDDGDGEFGYFDEEELLNTIQNMDVVAIGTGLGTNSHARKILELVVDNFTGPIVIDADAIKMLADSKDLIHDGLYVTPHSMEFSRLSGYTLNEIEYDRQGVVQNFLDKYDINIILKGKETIIADKENFVINQSGNSGMATAGSGDVLTGVVAALLAKNKSFEMLHLATYVHGLAGDFAKEKYGKTSLVASDIIECLPKAFGVVDENWCKCFKSWPKYY